MCDPDKEFLRAFFIIFSKRFVDRFTPILIDNSAGISTLFMRLPAKFQLCSQ